MMTHPERRTIMNAVRRKEISRVLMRLTELTEDLSDILGDIENIRNGESEAAADNLEEAL